MHCDEQAPMLSFWSDAIHVSYPSNFVIYLKVTGTRIIGPIDSRGDSGKNDHCKQCNTNEKGVSHDMDSCRT